MEYLDLPDELILETAKTMSVRDLINFIGINHRVRSLVLPMVEERRLQLLSYILSILMPNNDTILFDNGVDLSLEGPSDLLDDDPFNTTNYLTPKERKEYRRFLKNPTLERWLHYVNIFLMYPVEFFVNVNNADTNEFYEEGLYDVIKGLFDTLEERHTMYVAPDYDTLKKSKLIKLAQRLDLA